MSDCDDYFDNLDIDDSALEEIDLSRFEQQFGMEGACQQPNISKTTYPIPQNNPPKENQIKITEFFKTKQVKDVLESKHALNSATRQTWLYPTNYDQRDYQFNISRSSLFKNTLVSLPTGLGKTFIAAVVMYNYFRWFPEGKIVFLAPTKPLVNQQIDACYQITGISEVV
jgi:superfamily II DNA or RNA helicase